MGTSNTSPPRVRSSILSPLRVNTGVVRSLFIPCLCLVLLVMSNCLMVLIVISVVVVESRV